MFLCSTQFTCIMQNAQWHSLLMYVYCVHACMKLLHGIYNKLQISIILTPCKSSWLLKSYIKQAIYIGLCIIVIITDTVCRSFISIQASIHAHTCTGTYILVLGCKMPVILKQSNVINVLWLTIQSLIMDDGILWHPHEYIILSLTARHAHHRRIYSPFFVSPQILYLYYTAPLQ